MAETNELAALMGTLCEYIATAADRELPADVQERGTHHFLDTLAAMVSGSRLKPGRKATAWIQVQGGAPQACVIGTSVVTSVINAAMANGMFGHADETDDRGDEHQHQAVGGRVPGPSSAAGHRHDPRGASG